jgi:archaellin
MTRQRRVNHGPNIVKEAKAPATLERPTQTVKGAVLRDTITTGRDSNASGIHPVDHMPVAVTQTSGHTANLGQTTTRLNLKSVSIILLCHWEPPLHL